MREIDKSFYVKDVSSFFFIQHFDTNKFWVNIGAGDETKLQLRGYRKI